MTEKQTVDLAAQKHAKKHWKTGFNLKGNDITCHIYPEL
jgi:hypothetical protein